MGGSSCNVVYPFRNICSGNTIFPLKKFCMSSHLISLQNAIDLTTRFRDEKENILIQSLRDQNILPVCETFDRSAFDTLLAQSGCEAVRVYFSMDSSLKVKLVIVGVD